MGWINSGSQFSTKLAWSSEVLSWKRSHGAFESKRAIGLQMKKESRCDPFFISFNAVLLYFDRDHYVSWQTVSRHEGVSQPDSAPGLDSGWDLQLKSFAVSDQIRFRSPERLFPGQNDFAIRDRLSRLLRFFKHGFKIGGSLSVGDRTSAPTESSSEFLISKACSSKAVIEDIVKNVECPSNPIRLVVQVLKDPACAWFSNHVAILSQDARLVILPSRRWITENAEGLVNLFQSIVGPSLSIKVMVWVILHRQRAVRFSYLPRGCIPIQS